LQQAVVLPGLINAHDHLELNAFGRMKWRDHHVNVQEWIDDFQPRFQTDPALGDATPATLDDRLFIGALKNLLSGVTTVCHHNPLHPALKRRYPVRVVRDYAFSHSLGIDGDRVADAHRQTPAGWPWIVHAAEGIDERAASEAQQLDDLGCLSVKTVLVHGVALTPAAARRVIDCGGALVWCPSSNQFLFGATADVRSFDDAGRLAIGSDSRLSGDGDLLDEVRAAHATRQLSAASLVHAVTDGAARVLRLKEAGRLAPGVPADLCVIRRLSPDPIETVTLARRADVALTMIDGRPLLSDADFASAFSAPPARVTLDGVLKLMDRSMAGRASALTRFREPGLEVHAC
jgi:cytosine/adenosine deaminase-related metal-dependent hydrolase